MKTAMIALAVLAGCLVDPATPLMQGQDKKGEKKPTTVAAILDTIPKTIIPDGGKWPAQDALKADATLRETAKGKLLVVDFIVGSVRPTGPNQRIFVKGKVLVREKSVNFRGKTVQVSTYPSQEFAFPFSDEKKIAQLKPGQKIQLQVTLIHIILSPINPSGTLIVDALVEPMTKEGMTTILDR